MNTKKKYWLLFNREILQNNSPRWLETWAYISLDFVSGNIVAHGLQSPRGVILHNFPHEQSIFVYYSRASISGVKKLGLDGRM